MYEAVTAYPAGEATLSRFARTAESYGYDGIVRRRGSAGASIGRIGDELGIDVVDGVEIDTTDPSVLAGSLGTERTERTLVIVRGGDNRINRQAVEDPRVDVLSAPMRTGGDVNHVLAAAAKRNGVRLEFDLGPVLRRTGGARVRAVARLRKLREVVFDADTPFVVSGDPRSHLQLRAPRELAAVGEVIGFPADRLEEGLAEWGRLAARNRHRASDRVVEPGVEVETGRRDDSA
jgi:ribonuclease P/MRP protein subunit RPP1